MTYSSQKLTLTFPSPKKQLLILSEQSNSPRADWSDENRSPRYEDPAVERDNNSNASDEFDPPAPARRNPPEPDENLVTKLYEELRVVVTAHNKFEQFDLTRVWETAILLVRYGITSLESFRTTDGQARKYLFLRTSEKLKTLFCRDSFST